MVFSTHYPLGSKCYTGGRPKKILFEDSDLHWDIGLFSSPNSEQIWQAGGEDQGRRWEKEGVITLMILMSFPTQDSSPMGPAWHLLAESFTRTQIRCVWKPVWPKRGRVQLYLDLGGFPSQELPNPPSQHAAETSADI